jgi:hypothetical protein
MPNVGNIWNHESKSTNFFNHKKDLLFMKLEHLTQIDKNTFDKEDPVNPDGVLPKPNLMDIHCKTSSVAVIGGGIAGLTCARTLTDHGYDVTVFDKGRSPGGRTSTRRVESEMAFDHGAQYFTVLTPNFLRLVEALMAKGCVARWDGRIVNLKKNMAKEASHELRFVGVPGMSSVASHLAEGLSIFREVQIDQIMRVEGAWVLKDICGRSYSPYSYLVLALPAPQAASLLGTHPFATKVAGVAMAPCWAAMVAFQDRLKVLWDGAFLGESSLAWVARNSSKPGRPNGADCWVLHASAEWSAGCLEETPAIVSSHLLHSFEESVGFSLPKVIYQAAHRWRYSFGADPSGQRVHFDAKIGLGVCGDWLSGGQIEGAFLSGTECAKCIMG